MFDKLKYKTIKTALNFVGIKLTNKGCEKLLEICFKIQELIDIIKQGD